MNTKRTSDLPLICQICGEVARGINYNVMSCMPCKTFFRRHASKTKISFKCESNNSCEITTQTRGACTACRLNKCLSLGMKRNAIGRRFQNQINCLPQPLPLSLLRNDRSTLTSDEWNLLSNINHAYDAINTIPVVKNLLEEQSLLPLKMRSKSSITFNIIKELFSVLQPFVERSPYAQNLSTDACRALIQHNSTTFGTLNATFIMRELNALDYSAFLAGCHAIYGYEMMSGFNVFITRLERNGILIKIMLLILAYSTNCSIVNSDHTEIFTSTSDSISVFNIQNLFVNMLWKYLNYQYGFILAVQWLNSFIQYVLTIVQSMSENSHEQHSDLVETIVKETTRSLTIND